MLVDETRRARRTSLPWLAVCVSFLVLGAERPLAAYLDPGSGSMLLQVVLGGVAAVGVVARLYWHRLTSLFRRKRPDGTA